MDRGGDWDVGEAGDEDTKGDRYRDGDKWAWGWS